MLVDTGSDVTLVSSDVFKELNLSKEVLKKVSTQLTTADGDNFEVMGKTSFPLVIGEMTFDHTILVAGLGELSGILGMDFLAKNKVSIDTAEGILSSPSFNIKLQRDISSKNVCARVHVTDTVHIPAKSEIYVQGEIRGHFPGEQEGCIEPLVEFRGGKDLLLPKSIVKLSKSKVIFSILNPTADPKIIKKNIQVASVQPIEEVIQGNFQNSDKQDTSSADKVLPEHLRPLVENCSTKLSRTERAKLAQVVGNYSDVFVGPDGKLGHTDLVQHEIETGDAKPIRLPVTQRENAEEEINKMLDQGIIELSNSPWAAPIVLVRKKDGSTRFCVDYRKINSVTRKDAYPLPNINESLDSLFGA